jgi:hypothetical protein
VCVLNNSVLCGTTALLLNVFAAKSGGDVRLKVFLRHYLPVRCSCNRLVLCVFPHP